MLLFQIVEELSESLEMEREQLDKTVKENKADEMSAMYNMKMDEHRKQQGSYTVGMTYYNYNNLRAFIQMMSTKNPRNYFSKNFEKMCDCCAKNL